MLHLHFSNRLDLLAHGLIERLEQAPPASPWTEDVVVVPSAAVRRWLQRQIAQRRGVCAGIAFPYLAAWLWQLASRVLPQVQAESPFSPPVLAWRVHALLADPALVQAHPTLARYVSNCDPVMRFEFAGRVAAQLEQYVTYRPQWLSAWQSGRLLDLDAAGGAGDEAWQAALWQRLAADMRLGDEHPVHAMVRALADAFADARAPANAATVSRAGLEQPLHVFALPGMPPVYLQALRGLADFTQVHVHALNPCQEHWFETVDRRRLGWLRERGRDAGHEVGNRLLSAWGAASQAHLGALFDASGDGVHDDADFTEPEGSTLLAAWQRSVLEMEDLAPGSHPMDEDDRSVEVHVCHSLMRQVEVLHDHLLGLFERDPSLHPSRVGVVTPDLEAAAPLIEAVFGTAPPARRIDFTVTGRARSTVNAVARSLLWLLSLADSRLPASALAGLLQQPPVALRFGLDGAALDRLVQALRDSGMRWGFDAAHRAGLGLPEDSRHTLDDALQRLFLAEALPDAVESPFAGLWPARRLDATTLGAFWRLCQALRGWCDAVSRPLAPEDWAVRLREALSLFVDPGPEGIDDLREVTSTLDEVTGAMASAGLGQPGSEPVPLAVLRSALQTALDDPARGGVPAGGVTFASMSSMRGLPFDVICIIGLDNGVFPGRSQPAEFDLMARHPQRADRQRRGDDRQLFLDLLLAARRHVGLFHTGRSVRDNAPLPPSVLVSEWIDDVLVPAAAADPADSASRSAARRRLVTEHPLQAFSTECFDPRDPRRQSFDAELAQALRAGLGAASGPAESAGKHSEDDVAAVGVDGLSDDSADPSADPSADAIAEDGTQDTEDGEDEPQPPFFRGPLPPLPLHWHELTLDTLVEFLRQPAQALLRRRLHIDMAWDEEPMDDDEPFDLGWPDRRALAARLMPLLLGGADGQAVAAAALAGPELPGGLLGQLDLKGLLPPLQRLCERWQAVCASDVLPLHEAVLETDLDGERWVLRGSWSDLRAQGLARWIGTPLRGADRLEAWTHHLLLCAVPAQGAALRTQWLAPGEELAYGALEAGTAEHHLQGLLRLYRRGLCEPVRLFPKASWAFAEAGWKIPMAASAWARHDDSAGESLHPAHRLAWRGRDDALGGDFESIARLVFGPMRAAMEGRP